MHRQQIALHYAQQKQTVLTRWLMAQIPSLFLVEMLRMVQNMVCEPKWKPVPIDGEGVCKEFHMTSLCLHGFLRPSKNLSVGELAMLNFL